MTTGNETGPSGEHSRELRKSLLTKAVLLKDGDEIATVRVRNLSETGVGGISSNPLEKGMSCIVRMKGIGDIPGRVAWSQDVRIGIEFDEPVATEALKMTAPSEVKLPGSDQPPTRFQPIADPKRPGLTRRD